MLSNGVSTPVLMKGWTSQPRNHWVQSATNSLFGPHENTRNRLLQLIVVSCNGKAVRGKGRATKFWTSTASIFGRTRRSRIRSHRSVQCFRTGDLGAESPQPTQTRDERNSSSLHVMISSTNTHTCGHGRNPSSTNHARSVHAGPSVPPHSCYRLASLKPNVTKHPLCKPPSFGRPPPEMDGR